MTDLAGTKTAYFGFTGLIEPNGVGRIAATLNIAANKNYDEVYLCINSHGGLVGDGVFLYNHIRALPLKIIAHNIGSVSSIAVCVFVAAEERYCSSHAMFMVHPTTIGPFQEGMAWERLQGALNAALADDLRTENILRERTTIPDDVLSAKRVRDVHITPQEAVKFSLVHAVREFSLPQGHEIVQI